ncbi:hypothetical protein V3C99_015064, partial [Haemonchus contortus]
MMDGVVAIVTNFFHITFRKKACMGEVIVFECQRRGLLATYCSTNTIERIAAAIWFSVRLPSRRRKQSLLHFLSCSSRTVQMQQQQLVRCRSVSRPL